MSDSVLSVGKNAADRLSNDISEEVCEISRGVAKGAFGRDRAMSICCVVRVGVVDHRRGMYAASVNMGRCEILEAVASD